MRREVEEETGLTNVQLGELIGITNHEYFDPYLKKDVVKESHWYKMKVTGQTLLFHKRRRHYRYYLGR